MMTLEERVVSHCKGKMAEHHRAAADHTLKGQMYQEMIDLVEREVSRMKRENPVDSSAGAKP